MKTLSAAAIAAACVAAPALAATMFTGNGETDYGYRTRGECCEDAVLAAQDDGARACEQSGGYADFKPSAARGRCDSERTRGADGQAVYRCTATVSVPCR